MHSHGMSVVRIKRGSAPARGCSRPILRSRTEAQDPRRRRVPLDGPAAGDARLRTVADHDGPESSRHAQQLRGRHHPVGDRPVRGGEPNQYFDKSGALDSRYTAEYARYGITGMGRGWSAVDPRFDLTVDPHEPHRFGWIVEIDPLDQKSTPREHTMLGRFQDEGANIAIAQRAASTRWPTWATTSAVTTSTSSSRRGKFLPGGTVPKARRNNLQLLHRRHLVRGQAHR